MGRVTEKSRPARLQVEERAFLFLWKAYTNHYYIETGNWEIKCYNDFMETEKKTFENDQSKMFFFNSKK